MSDATRKTIERLQSGKCSATVRCFGCGHKWRAVATNVSDIARAAHECPICQQHHGRVVHGLSL